MGCFNGPFFRVDRCGQGAATILAPSACGGETDRARFPLEHLGRDGAAAPRPLLSAKSDSILGRMARCEPKPGPRCPLSRRILGGVRQGRHRLRGIAARRLAVLVGRWNLLSIAVAVLWAGCQAGPESAGPDAASGDQRAAAVTFERGDRRIRVMVGDLHLTTFHYDERWDKPFLHPIRTASGLTVSRGYPVDPSEEEVQDHDWHRGIWYGHGDISGHDFWRELGRDKTGMIVPLAPPELEEGEARGAIESSAAGAGEAVPGRLFEEKTRMPATIAL